MSATKSGLASSTVSAKDAEVGIVANTNEQHQYDYLVIHANAHSTKKPFL